MKCPKCNFENDEKTIFCKKCGERLAGKPSEITDSIKEENFRGKKTESNTTADQVLSNDSAVNQGCVSKAWNDISSSSHWVKKLLFAALCNIIPIVNFASCGYAQKWGVKAAKGNKDELKEGIFEDNSIKTGFFECVTWIAYGIVFFVASSILNAIFNNIIVVGTIVGIALIIINIIYDSFISLACMKSAIDDKLSSSFNIKNIWTSFKKDFWNILWSTFIPGLLCKLIALAFAIAFTVIIAWQQIPNMIYLVSNYQLLLTNTQAIMWAFQMLSTVVLDIIVSYMGFAFMGGIEKIVRYRAIGHYINQHSFN